MYILSRVRIVMKTILVKLQDRSKKELMNTNDDRNVSVKHNLDGKHSLNFKDSKMLVDIHN